jgi:hypothetical protein
MPVNQAVPQAQQPNTQELYERAENQLVDSLALALAAVARQLYAQEQETERSKAKNSKCKNKYQTN